MLKEQVNVTWLKNRPVNHLSHPWNKDFSKYCVQLCFNQTPFKKQRIPEDILIVLRMT